MNPYKLFIILVSLIPVKGYAQEKCSVKFGKITAEDFNISSALINENTNAVIIADVGSGSFEGNKRGSFTYVHKRQIRIKIINKKALKLATVKIRMFKKDWAEGKQDNVSASSYNILNGSITETKLNPDDVYDEKISERYYYRKFVVPNVKEGSIIEYTYTVKSNLLFFIPTWYFQSIDAPTLWSEYNITIPGFLSYKYFISGYYNFFINTGEEGYERYHLNNGFSVSTSTTIHRWVKKDIPAFNVENYVYTSENFLDQVNFQLFKTYNGREYTSVSDDWKKLAADLMESDYFAKHIDDEVNYYWLDKIINSITTTGDGELDKLKKIYSYIQDNYTCTNDSYEQLTTTLEDVVKRKGGTVGDINLLLITMLRRSKFSALPVLLSTRENGRCSEVYPQMQRINYVICKVNIDSTTYYIDAATPFLPFGKLSDKCYNGYAHVVSWDSTTVDLDPGLAKNYCQVTNFINNGQKNVMEGSYTHNMGFFESITAKNDIAKSSLVEYKKGLKLFPIDDVQVDSINIENYHIKEKDISVKVNYKLNGFEDKDIIYFNPMMGEAVTKNPFDAAQRLYPVEMPYVKDDIYTLNMEIPKGYAIDEMPKSTRIFLNENEGLFEYILSVEDGIIYLKCMIRFKKAIFQSNDYENLRDFYAQIVKKQAEQIVFKKIK